MSNAVKARIYEGVLVMYHTQRGEWESSKANDGILSKLTNHAFKETGTMMVLDIDLGATENV